MGVNSLPKTVIRKRRDCDLNPGPSASASSTEHANYSATEYQNIYKQETEVSRQNASMMLAD